MTTIDRSKVLKTKNLLSAFKIFDKENKGILTVKDIKRMFNLTEKIVGEHVWEQLLAEVDCDNNG